MEVKKNGELSKAGQESSGSTETLSMNFFFCATT